VVPLQWAGQLLCRLLNIRVPETWIKNEGFKVVRKKQRTMPPAYRFWSTDQTCSRL